MRLRVTSLASFALVASLCLACSGDGTDPDPLSNACDDYCTLVIRSCEGDVAQYPDLTACEATCAVMAQGNPGDRSGNTIACRTFWASAAEGNPQAFCRRAGPGGDGTCGTNCESFCATTLAICADQENPPYDSLMACNEMCATYDMTQLFDANDLGGNSLACRIYHMTAASTVPGEHCPHTQADSSVCVGPP